MEVGHQHNSGSRLRIRVVPTSCSSVVEVLYMFNLHDRRREYALITVIYPSVGMQAQVVIDVGHLGSGRFGQECRRIVVRASFVSLCEGSSIPRTT